MRVQALLLSLSVCVAGLHACGSQRESLDRQDRAAQSGPVVPDAGSSTEAWLQVATPGHSAPIMRVAADTRRDLVVTASDDKTARIWSLSTGRSVAVLRPPVGVGRIGGRFGAAIHPQRDIVAIGGTGSANAGLRRSIWLYSLSNGRYLSHFDARASQLKRLEWSDDGGSLIACYARPGAIRVFDAAGALRFEQTFGGDCLALATRADRVVAASRDGKVHLFRFDKDRFARTGGFDTGLDPVAIALSPDASMLAVGFFTPGAGSQVHSASTGRLAYRLQTRFDVRSPGPADPISKTLAIAWSSDGRSIVSAGALDEGGRTEGRIRSFGATDGRLVLDQAVSADSITDLAALPAGAGPPGDSTRPAGSAIVWSSFDGSWGVFDGHTAQTRSRAQVPFLTRGAARELRISPDASAVRWARGAERESASFDVTRRIAGNAEAKATLGAVTHLSATQVATKVENDYAPAVNGRPIALRTGEVSRALTFVGADGDTVLATDEGLRRLDRSLQTVWRVDTPTEARAVSASADGRLLVGQLSDGTVRWWRAADGALLLSLLAIREGWVLWTPTGHYDAGHGGESLIGWLVPGAVPGPVPEFFTVSRFRDRYLRPDVIDRVLAVADPVRALKEADRELLADPGKLARIRPPAPPDTTPSQAAPTGAAKASPAMAIDRISLPDQVPLPPMLSAMMPLRIAPGTAALRFSVRTSLPPRALSIETRIDGLLVEPQRLSLPDQLDGTRPGEVVVTIPVGARLAQIVARVGTTASEPLRFSVDGVQARGVEPLRANGTLYLLAIGVASYRDRRIALELPAKDARDFVALMRLQQGALYRTVEARLLTDAQADRNTVIAGLDWLRNRVGPDDVGIAFLAGHGVSDATGAYHFLPADVDTERIAETSISGLRLEQTLASLKGRALLFVDTCHAGSAFGALSRVSRDTARLSNSLAAPENAISVFASSTDRQESLENDRWGNGAFTKILVEALKGGARASNRAIVTNRTLPPYLRSGVARLTGGAQTPVAVVPDSLPERIISIPGAP